ncbi:T9SS type A sorting domain-containing protein [Fulvivirga sediminis]|uniref:T9SS type A sorting domain-containing protein n=1 Tax=Fulvivirga sediminis TaxID=2803949 RepID=A0A937FCV3_9BACT|nr:T9SS type A sorting domain-containing protein [Fulvivirga sediminis]MBL3658575.1 T9SS type A sorting domain-containing protein [Fulvivirga sediminis]
MKKLFFKGRSILSINLAFLIFSFFLLNLSVSTHVSAQDSYAQGQYRIKLEVIELCGYGGSDSDGTQDYRWHVGTGPERDSYDGVVQRGAFNGALDAILFKGMDFIGIDDFPTGGCITEADNYDSHRVGALLPYVVYDSLIDYRPDLILDFHLVIRAYEKDCMGNDHYDMDCSRGTEDDDFRWVVKPISFTIDEEIGSGIINVTKEDFDTKYSAKIRYTITPPVMHAPQFAYEGEYDKDNPTASGTQVVCGSDRESDYNYYIFWKPGNYPIKEDRIEKLEWYEKSTIPGEGAYKLIATTTKNSPHGLYAIKLPTPEVRENVTKYYSVKIYYKDNVTNLDYSPNSLPVDIFPPPPPIIGLPQEVDGILNKDEEPLYSNEYFDIQHVLCKGDNTGYISIKRVDDDRELYITVDSDQGGNDDPVGGISESNPVIISDLVAGSYLLTIEVKDEDSGTECYSTANIVIKQPSSLPTATAETYKYVGGAEVSCYESEDGIITLSGEGGTSPYEFHLSSNEGFSEYRDDSVYTSLPPVNGSGDDIVYTFDITDRYDCAYEGTEDIILSRPDPLKFVQVVPANEYHNPNDNSEYYNISCFGGADTVNFTLSGGATPYQLYIGADLMASTQGVSQETFIGNLYGDTTYEVLMRDPNGCELTTTASLTQPNEIILDARNILPASCYGSATASVGLLAKEGLPYQGQSYYYTLTHLEVPPDLEFPFDEQRATESPVDSAVFEQLISGYYQVKMEDYYGCQGFDTVFMPQPDRLNTLLSSTSLICKGDEDGSVTATIEGGTAPYYLTWQDQYKQTLHEDTMAVSASVDMQSLNAGLYYLLVKDDNGCSYPRSGSPFSIDEPAMDFDLSYNQLQQATCFGSADGSITLQASGGWRNAAYKYGLTKVDMQYENRVFSQLEAGDYLFYAEDARGCVDSLTIQIEDPDELSVRLASLNNVLCSGAAEGSFTLEAQGGVPPYQYSIDQGRTWLEEGVFTDLAAGDYEVIVSDSYGNCPLTKQVHIYSPASLTILPLAITSTECLEEDGTVRVDVSGGVPPYVYSWKKGDGIEISNDRDLLNAEAGRYQLSITDNNGCTKQEYFGIANTNAPEPVAINVDHVTCYGLSDGVIALELQSGNIATWPDGTQGIRKENLPEGSYLIQIENTEGCINFIEVDISAPKPFELLVDKREPSCYDGCDGSLEVSLQGGTPPYEFTWSGGVSGSGLYNLCAGVYQLDVVDANGCTFSEVITLEQPIPISPDLGGGSTVCEGQTVFLDAGYPGSDYSWIFEGEQIGISQTLLADMPGRYEVLVTDMNGCTGTAEYELEISNEVLSAEYLVLSEAVAGDTVVLVNVSYPEPTTSEWQIPEEVISMEKYGYHQQVIFPEPGTYTITLNTQLGGCEASMSKEIIVTGASGETSKEEFGKNDDSIKSFTVYPNPNSGKFTANVMLTEVQPIKLQFLRLQGQGEIAIEERDGAKEYDVPFEFDDLKPGVYFLILQSKDITKTLKIIIE